jgi:predicted RNase H-like nuclease
VRVAGLDLPRGGPESEPVPGTLVLLGDRGRIAAAEPVDSLAAAANAVVRLAAGEAFLLGVDLPVVVPAKHQRQRAVEARLGRRFGVRLAPGGRGAAAVPGETLIAGLAAAGQPCLPWPDRDRRQSGLLETHPVVVLKSLLWQRSGLAAAVDGTRREELFRAYAAPSYRAAELPARTGWAERAARLDLALSALGTVDGFDFDPARQALAKASSAAEAEHAAGLFDAALVAGTALRYLDAPEACLFLGDQEQGYVVLPADSFIRRYALAGASDRRRRLFPMDSLSARLGATAVLHDVDLLVSPGRPRRTEAIFQDPPRYEFDNVDEMLWWKHCRHLAGTRLPTDGLRELVVELGGDGAGAPTPLRLMRSRHPTLSFRFEPAAVWRSRLPTRDGKTYPLRVVRAVYEVAPGE